MAHTSPVAVVLDNQIVGSPLVALEGDSLLVEVGIAVGNQVAEGEDGCSLEGVAVHNLAEVAVHSLAEGLAGRSQAAEDSHQLADGQVVVDYKPALGERYTDLAEQSLAFHPECRKKDQWHRGEVLRATQY